MLHKWEVYTLICQAILTLLVTRLPLSEKQLCEALVNTIVSTTRFNKCIFSIRN